MIPFHDRYRTRAGGLLPATMRLLDVGYPAHESVMTSRLVARFSQGSALLHVDDGLACSNPPWNENWFYLRISESRASTARSPHVCVPKSPRQVRGMGAKTVGTPTPRCCYGRTSSALLSCASLPRASASGSMSTRTSGCTPDPSV